MKRTPKPTRIDRLIESLLSRKAWRQGILGAQIKEQWAAMVGPEIAAHARPVKLYRQRLEVHCDHDVWRTELMYLRPEILVRIAEVFGPETVKEIWLK